MIVQSYTGWPNIRTGGPVKTEDDPLDPDPPRAMRPTLDAIRYLEKAVIELAHGRRRAPLRQPVRPGHPT